MSRVCGRPTKRPGAPPCQQQLSDRFEVACKAHATDHDREIAKVGRGSWEAGFKAGEESGANYERLRQRNEQREQARQSATATPLRLTDGDAQIVEVGRYAYRWVGSPPLEVGDRVVLPSNWLFHYQTTGTVTGLGTSYTGPLATVVRVVERVAT